MYKYEKENLCQWLWTTAGLLPHTEPSSVLPLDLISVSVAPGAHQELQEHKLLHISRPDSFTHAQVHGDPNELQNRQTSSPAAISSHKPSQFGDL